jgi:manganese/zinc/iron transport system ATP- binding protein
VKKTISIQELTVNYETSTCLWDISLEIPQGVIAGVVGPNGAGKSTLFKAMLGLVDVLAGRVSYFGKPLCQMRGEIAYVPQRKSVDWEFPVTVLDVVLMGVYNHKGFWNWVSKKERAEAIETLKRVGMEKYSHRQISDLSGGQQQKVFLARAMMQKANVFLLDEPFTGIDMTTESTLLALFQELKSEGKTLIVIHHDLSTVEKEFDWVCLLNTRVVASGDRDKVLTKQNILNTYGVKNAAFEEALLVSKKKEQGLVDARVY